jgi:capsular polysaccharide biosynthesis protein
MSENQNTRQDGLAEDDDDSGMSISELLGVLREHLKLLTIAPLAAGLLALGITTLIAPTFTAVTTFMPPQQSQSSAGAALASLGSLTGLAGGAAGISTPGERYVALMKSVKVSDRIIEQFDLMDVYDEEFRVDARKELATNVRIALGKKDGLITVEVDDKSQQRAADIANHYVDELRRLTRTLAVTEPQQRRAFFELQLQQSRDRLVQAE